MPIMPEHRWLYPYPDQVARDVVPLRQPVQRLAAQKLLRHLTLELDAVRSVSWHGLSSESPAARSIQLRSPVRCQGPTPKPDGLTTTTDIIGLLQTALDAADKLNLHTGAIHINEAIIALGGLGSASPEPV
jgi:hypothetical protein